ncbi:MAG: hypothetical protein AB1521_11385 [Bacteroidota bacterium]
MLNDETKMIINKYFDNELPKSIEVVIFEELSKDEESREYFKQINKMKLAVQGSTEEFPLELDQKILMKVRALGERKQFWRRPFVPVLSYSFAVVLLIISLFMYFEIRSYKTDLQLTTQQMIEQQKTINLLINSLPSVDVETEIQNAVIVKANL